MNFFQQPDTRIEMRPGSVVVIGVTAGLIFAVIFVLNLLNFAQWSAATKRQQVAAAEIVEEVGWNRAPIYRYEFAAAGRTFSGRAEAQFGERYPIGGSMTVYFDATNPHRNSFAPLSEVAAEYAWGAAYMAIFIVGWIGVWTWTWRAAKRRLRVSNLGAPGA